MIFERETAIEYAVLLSVICILKVFILFLITSFDYKFFVPLKFGINWFSMVIFSFAASFFHPYWYLFIYLNICSWSLVIVSIVNNFTLLCLLSS